MELTYEQGDHIVDGLIVWAELGEGCWCRTWMAWSVEHGCPVAVKLPQSHEKADDARRVMRREVGWIEQIRHPAFQRLLVDGSEAPSPFLVFDYIEGPTLSTVLEEDHHLMPPDAATIASELALTVGYLHHNGWAHMDIKPHNVILRNGRVVVLDVGHMLALGTVMPCGQRRGTGGYCGPEAWDDGRPIDVLQDIFGIGAVLYELVVGEAAFERGRPDEAADLTVFHRRAGDPLTGIVERSLALDPGVRQQSTQQLVHELAEAIPAHERLWCPELDAAIRPRHADQRAGALAP
jgi:serine/threonine protein kinase